MTKKQKFFWTSLIFNITTVLFMVLDNNQTFSWVKLLVGYGIFALLYSILGNISISDET